MIAFPLETSYYTFLLRSRDFLKFQLESYFLPHSLSYKPDSNLVEFRSSEATPYPFRKYDGVPEERMPTSS